MRVELGSTFRCATLRAESLSRLFYTLRTSTMLSRLAASARFLSTASTYKQHARLLATVASKMTIEVAPLPLPPSADASKFADFGREVKGVNPRDLTQEQLEEIRELLYKASLLTIVRSTTAYTQY